MMGVASESSGHSMSATSDKMKNQAGLETPNNNSESEEDTFSYADAVKSNTNRSFIPRHYNMAGRSQFIIKRQHSFGSASPLGSSSSMGSRKRRNNLEAVSSPDLDNQGNGIDPITVLDSPEEWGRAKRIKKYLKDDDMFVIPENMDAADDVMGEPSIEEAHKFIVDLVQNDQIKPSSNWERVVCAKLQVRPSHQLLLVARELIEKYLFEYYKSYYTKNQNPKIIEREVTLFIDILSLLRPTRGEKKPNDFTDEKAANEIELEVASCSIEETQVDQMKKKITGGSKAYERVSILLKACKVYIEQLKSNESELKAMDERHTKIEDNMKKIQAFTDQIKHSNELESNEKKKQLQRTQDLKDNVNLQIDKEVKRRAQELYKAGETESGAMNQAYLETLQSKQHHIVALLQSLETSKKDYADQRHELATITCCIDYIVKAKCLLDLVIQNVLQTIQLETKRLKSRQIQTEAVACEKLKEHIPKLFMYVREYEASLSTKQLKAEEILAKKQEEFASHCELFGDDAPLEKKDIRNRINEYKKIISSCETELEKTGGEVVDFWTSHKHALPRDVHQLLKNEVYVLWNNLDGTMKKMLTDFVAGSEMTSSSASASQVAPNAVVPEEKSSIQCSFKVGDRLYTKFIVGGKGASFYAGVVTALHPDGTYTVKYDNGDVHKKVPESVLFTEEKVSQVLELTSKKTKEKKMEVHNSCMIQ